MHLCVFAGATTVYIGYDKLLTKFIYCSMSPSKYKMRRQELL